jgi:transposase
MAGCAPIPVSAGRTDRHRLDRGGNRQLNHAIHLLAISKMSHDPRTAVYIAKQRARGKPNREAIRSLKRHLVRRIYNLIRTPTHVPVTLCLT